MWKRRWNKNGGFAKFFHLTLSHDDLANYYTLNFQLLHHYNYSLTELESMMPWEREIYTEMLIKYLKDEKEKINIRQRQRKFTNG